MSTYVKGNRVLIDGALTPATIEIKNGKIAAVSAGAGAGASIGVKDVLIDAGDNVLMPGIVDSHVHVNEPGRTEWEGFWTATRAALAGGITTLIDMPLNSIPPTTTVQNLKTKMEAAKGKCHVDVGFWGGVVPDNANELKAMVQAGVVGFKCFLIESGVDEFPCVDKAQVEAALKELKGAGSLLAFHAEMETAPAGGTGEDPGVYSTFLRSRPPGMEYRAIEMVAELCKKYADVRCHIVHLSASEALPIIAQLKSAGFPLTVETCPHYLTLAAEEITTPRSTQYKCCPPIRDAANQGTLWDAVLKGLIDLIVSDHSPCTAELKQPGQKDFMEAWGGISSVQFGLPIIWTKSQAPEFKKVHGEFGVADISRLMSTNSAKLVGLEGRKGRISIGYDADFVIWNPELEIKVEEGIIQHRNKITPYKGKTLRGKVLTTILRGEVVYKDGEFTEPKGQFVFPNKK